MPKNQNAPIIQDGDAQVTGQLQAGSVAVQELVLSQINSKLAVDGTAVLSTTDKNVLNGYAGLDANGKLLSSVIPAIGISSVSVVASEAAQLALTAQEGDVAVRSDLSKTFIRNSGTAGTIADWTELLSPTDAVSSVAGKTGTVTLVKADITDFNGADYAAASHTHAISDVTSLQTAIDALKVYDIHSRIESVPTTAQVVLRAVLPRAITIADDLAGSRLKAGVAATAQTVFEVKKNGTVFGTITVAADGTTGTFATSGGSESCVAGDVITVVGPSTVDDTIAQIAIAIKGALA